MIAKPGTKVRAVLDVFKSGPASLIDVIAETSMDKKTCAALIDQLRKAGKIRIVGRVPSDRGGSGSNLYVVRENTNGLKDKTVERFGYHKWPGHPAQLSYSKIQKCLKCQVLRKKFTLCKPHYIIYSSNKGETRHKVRPECLAVKAPK